MKSRGRVGVIGGGLGGLAAACTLAARGHDVVLLERNSWLGGKAAVLEGGGYRFDMGPTILTVPSVLRRVFAEAGRRLEDHLDLVPLDPQWRCFYADGSSLDLVADAGEMARRLEGFTPGGTGRGYRDFLSWSKRLHEISERFFFWKSVGGLRDVFSPGSMLRPGTLRDVLTMRPGKTVARCVRGHVTDRRVAQLLDHFTQYVGSAPDRSPAVLCAIAHMQTAEGVWYPRGGTGAVPKALAALAAELGVEVRTGVEVRRILLDAAGAVAGVELVRGERLPLAAVVSNMDAVRTYRDLLASAPVAARFERHGPFEPACSGVVLYLGLDRAYEHLAHHNFVFSADPEEEFDAVYRRGEPAPDPTCYVAAPARTEADVAPPGGEALYVLVHAPYLRLRHDWRGMLPGYREVILKKLADTAGLTDLEGRIRFEAHLTPQDIHDRYRVLNGAIYGLASHGRWLGAFKPANRRADVPGLYLAGGAAHPGPGMPMVLMSGWIAADAVDRDMPARTSSRLPSPLGGEGRGEKEATLSAPLELPRRWTWLVRLFTRYVRRYLGRHFHAVRLAREGRPVDPGSGPLVVVMNHPAWWDPLVGAVLAGLFPGRAAFAPIDAAELGKYHFFGRLGFFGVEQGTPAGALAFLRRGLAVCSRSGAMLWVTAQGRFTDPRERPVRLRPGLGRLLCRLDGGVVLPLAVEYPFWEERTPEALARFGSPLTIGEGKGRTAEEWTACVERGLEATQNALAADAVKRDAAAFEVLIGGSAGVGGVYDLWRRLKAFFRGEPFRADHGQDPPTTEGALP